MSSITSQVHDNITGARAEYQNSTPANIIASPGDRLAVLLLMQADYDDTSDTRNVFWRELPAGLTAELVAEKLNEFIDKLEV